MQKEMFLLLQENLKKLDMLIYFLDDNFLTIQSTEENAERIEVSCP